MDKKKSSNATTSIDEKHNEMMSMYYVIENETIPNVQNEIKEMIADARNVKNKKSETYFEKVDKIKEKKKELKQLQQSKNDYLLHNAKYIFHYYEEKQKINLGENVKDKKTIHTFFKLKGNTNESSNLNSERYNQSKRLFQQYWKNVGQETIHLQEYVLDSETCLMCNQGELIPLEEEGVLICNNKQC